MAAQRLSRRQRLELSEVRSTLWTIQQLTSKSASAGRSARSFSFELHAISTRALDRLESFFGAVVSEEVKLI